MSAPRTRIGLREIRAMSPNQTIFDGGTGSVPGFGARRRAGPHVSYFIMYRTRDGRQRRYTIGTHGAPRTPDAARAKAQQVLVAARIEGADPQADKKAKRSAATIAELCDMYMEDAEAGRLLTRRGIAKKPSTLVTDRSFIQAHIKPPLGRMKVPAVTREDVEHFMHQVPVGSDWFIVGIAKADLDQMLADENQDAEADAEPADPSAVAWMAKNVTRRGAWKHDGAIIACRDATHCTDAAARAAWNSLPPEVKGTRGRPKKSGE